MLTDLRIAIRTLLKSPGFSITAAGALALGIGANTAIFSVVNEVLLNPAGISDPSRVVVIRARYDKLALTSIPVSVPDFADVQKSTQLIESAAMMNQGNYNYTGGGVPERLQGAPVSYHWFDVFGAKPRIGRVFRAEEDQPNANQEVVLSFAAWKRLFGQDPSVLNRTIELNQTPYHIIGVMGPEFRWPANADLWVPLGLAPSVYTENNRFNENYTAVALLKPGVDLGKAQAWVEVLNNRVRNNGTRGGQYAKDSAWAMFLMPFTDFVAGPTKTPILVLLGAVGFVLLIACSNIAGLMLARSSGRVKEIAIRAALGASRWDMMRQTLAESLLLAFIGAVVGLGVAYAGIRGLLLLAPANSPVALDVRMDATVLLFTAGAAIVAGLLFGIIPAIQTARLDRYDALKEGGRAGTAGLGRQRLRAGLVIAEVALALVLLVGAGLFLRSLAALQDVNPGFQPGGVVTATVALPNTQYKDPAKRLAFYRDVIARLSSLPGVTNAASGIPVPFAGQFGSASFAIEGRPSPPGDPGPHGDIGYVSPGYFAALKIPVRSGRVFDDHDQTGSDPVAMVDETLAKQYWPDENPIGKHIRNGGPNTPWSTIVGVVGHVKSSDLAGDLVKGKYYYPLYQQPILFNNFLVRSQADPAALTNSIREAVQAVDPSQAVSNVTLLSDLVSASLAPRRFVVILLEVFAGMALLLAVLGLYGVISYSVTQRTQEIGIRMALGAQRGEVMGMVIRQGMILAGIGAGIGLVASVVFSSMLRSQFFGVSAFDPLTFSVTVLVLVSAAFAGSYIPARRATKVDPMNALRYE